MGERLKNRVAMVTGAGRGIGSAIASALAAEGAAVALLARTKTEIESAAEQIRKSKGRAHAFACDVTRPADVDAAVRAIVKELGPVDVLVNNAGIVGATGPTASYPIEEWARVLEVNL